MGQAGIWGPRGGGESRVVWRQNQWMWVRAGHSGRAGFCQGSCGRGRAGQERAFVRAPVSDWKLKTDL